MKLTRGPYLTLLAGLVLAAVLLGLDIRATPSRNVAQQVGSASPATPSDTGTPTASSVITAPPSSPATPPSTPNPAVHDYAGRVDGGGASVAISVYQGKAIAYVCGGKFEVWLTGTAKDGKLGLTSRYGATLTATYDGTGAHGLVTGSGRHWTFTAPSVKAPSGLYRAFTKYQGTKIRATWIVLPDGSQVGAADSGGDTATAAPVGPIDFGTGSAVMPDGSTVQPTRIDGYTEGS